MHRIFPNRDSLCLNFGRTGVFQWNTPNSSMRTQTTEWPQSVAGFTLRSCELAGLTHTPMEPQPRMPYVIFRHMGPHFDSYANSGIPDIIGTQLGRYRSEHEQRAQLLDLLPHLQLIDVGTDLEHRWGDLQTLTDTILSKVGQRPPSHPDHPSTRRSTALTRNSLGQEKHLASLTAECVIHILCNTDLAYRLTERGYKVPGLDYLGSPHGASPLGQPTMVYRFLGDKGEHLNRSEGWGNWFESITRVCKFWHNVTQSRRSNPSYLAVCDYLGEVRGGSTSEARILREIRTSHSTYTQLQSIILGKGSITSNNQVHELICTLCDLTPTLQHLALLNTDTSFTKYRYGNWTQGRKVTGHTRAWFAGQHRAGHLATRPACHERKGVPELDERLPLRHGTPRLGRMRTNCAA